MSRVILEAQAGKMHDDVFSLAGFGNRFAGSKEEALATEFLKKRFENMSYRVLTEEFSTPVFYEDFSRVSIANEGEDIDCRAMYYSVATPPAGIWGELVYVGKGRPEDYAGKDVAGKIVIFERDREAEKDQFWVEICTAANKGAKGAILINFMPWVFITTLETGFFDYKNRFLPIEPEPIPAVVIGSADGADLLRRMDKAPVTVHLVVNTVNTLGESNNLRAIKKGDALSAERIVVFGHKDSAGTPGANDNGSGLAIMLEIARILRDKPMKRTVEFLALGAEEQLGAEGSRIYVDRHRDEIQGIRAAIEMDMVGVGSPLMLILGGKWADRGQIDHHQELSAFIKTVAAEMGCKLDYGFCELGTSDDGRFSEAGIPTAWLWSPGDMFYHTPQDTPEKVDPNRLKMLADILATTVYRLANMPDITW